MELLPCIWFLLSSS